MATSTKTTPGVRLQVWTSPVLAAEVRRLAESEDRSVSDLIRLTLRDRVIAQGKRQ